MDNDVVEVQMNTIIAQQQAGTYVAPTAPIPLTGVNMQMLQMLGGNADDMMAVQMIINNPALATQLLDQIDTEAIRGIITQQIMVQGKGTRHAASPNAQPQMKPAVVLMMIDQADGDMRDFMIQQAIMQKQVPPYMFPMLLEECDNGNLKKSITAYLVAQATGAAQVPQQQTPGPRARGAVGPTQQQGATNPQQVAMVLESMDGGNM